MLAHTAQPQLRRAKSANILPLGVHIYRRTHTHRTVQKLSSAEPIKVCARDASTAWFLFQFECAARSAAAETQRRHRVRAGESKSPCTRCIVAIRTPFEPADWLAGWPATHTPKTSTMFILNSCYELFRASAVV